MLWLTTASLLSAFNITKAVDENGNPIEAEIKYTSSLVWYVRLISFAPNAHCTFVQSSLAFQVYDQAQIPRGGASRPNYRRAFALIRVGKAFHLCLGVGLLIHATSNPIFKELYIDRSTDCTCGTNRAFTDLILTTTLITYYCIISSHPNERYVSSNCFIQRSDIFSIYTVDVKSPRNTACYVPAGVQKA